MVTRRKFITGVAAVPFLSYLSFESALAATPTNMLVMAMQLDNMTSLDPHESFEMVGNEITSNLYQRLLSPNIQHAEVLDGDLAESWQVSADNKTFTFILRQNAKFSDGSDVTADDVAFSLQRVIKMNKSPAFIINQFGFTPDNVDQLITAKDKYTVVINTLEPVTESFLLYCLGANVGGIVQKSQVLAHQKEGDLGNGWLRQNSAGSGAFKLNSWNASESVILDANTHSPNSGKIKRIILRHIMDPSTQYLLLEKGDIDIARNLTTEQLKKVMDNSKFTLVQREQAYMSVLSCNTRYTPLSNPKVWQALKWAVDYHGIQQNIVPLTHKVHQSFLPQGFPAAIPDEPYKKDVAKAKELLAEAGYPNGFEVTLDHFSAAPYADIAQALQANLAEVGIKVTLISGEVRQVLTKMRARQHQLILSFWGADYFDPNSNAETFCINEDNSDETRIKTLAWRSSWQDAEMNDMAKAALHETDTAKRIALYQKLQRIHLTRSPFIILLQDSTSLACGENVKGVEVSVINNYPYYKVTKV